MTDSDAVHIAVQTLIVAGKVCAPILLVSLAVGFGVSLLQSLTQLQDVTLTFVPKLVGVAGVIAVGGHWMLAELVGFTRQLFDMVPQLVNGG